MQEKDEDATLTQLAQVRFNLYFLHYLAVIIFTVVCRTLVVQAWTNLAQGGEKIQEAYYIYQASRNRSTATNCFYTVPRRR